MKYYERVSKIKAHNANNSSYRPGPITIEEMYGHMKVTDEDLPAVYRKLMNSKVAVLIPTEMALRDHEGNIASGGLFAVPHIGAF